MLYNSGRRLMKIFTRFTEKSIPWLFALLIGLAYGLMLFQTGFYWDDWPFAWAAHFIGPESFIGSFLRVRPFLGPIFWFTTSLLPETPLAWQSFALVMRFLLTLAAWWAFRQIWPAHPWQTLLAALAFLVYPGYSQHWVAFTHINQELIPLLFYILSFGMTGLTLHTAMGTRRRTALGLLFLTLGVFPTEYFLSLEPLRFLFILSIFSGQEKAWKPLVWRSIKAWVPYLAVWGLNALWLLVYYRSGIYANYDVVVGEIAPSLTGIAADFFLVSLEAVWKAGLYAWALLPLLAARTLSAPSTWLALGAAGLAMGSVWLFLRRLSLSRPFSASQSWALQAMLLGLVGLVLGRLPSWAAGLPLTLQSSFDRFTVSIFLAASLFLAGLLTLVLRRERAWLFAAALVVGLSVGQQVYSANVFRRDWERQRSFYWQLAWRIPALAPGTVLLTDEVEIDYETDYALTAPLNWMYAPDFSGARLPYLVLGVAGRPNRLPALQAGHAFEFAYRPVRFYGDTGQAIVFLAPPGSCLRILDPAFDSDATFGKVSPLLAQLLPLSNPSLIATDAPTPSLPQPVFGSEPPPAWCYYYTKAELARQRGDWPEVARLGDEASARGFRPAAPVEWLPFIEAYALTGQAEQAKTLSQTALQTASMRKGVCAVWQRVAEKQPLGEGLSANAIEIMEALGCR
jgi:hypothetical protein